MQNTTKALLLSSLLLFSAGNAISDESSSEQPMIKPFLLEKSYFEGKGLTKGDHAEFDGEGISSDKPPVPFSTHAFHVGKIMVSIYESEPTKVYIDGMPFDEYVQILEGRLILTTDDGKSYEFKAGDSLMVPQGFKGYWEMPEKYRELIIINTDYGETSAEGS